MCAKQGASTGINGGKQIPMPGFEERQIKMLSKTRFIGGLQCLKRLYLESYNSELIPPVGPALQALFNSGSAIGGLARDLFPGGSLITESNLVHNNAVARTKGMLAASDIPAVYEAAFTFDGIRIRVDILGRLPSQKFFLAEVKSSTSVKKVHIADAAVQVYVAEGSGVEIEEIYLIHINNKYLYEGGDYELEQLFHKEDITDEVRSYMAASFLVDLKQMKGVLSQFQIPIVNIGKHCKTPYECPFYAHCREGLPAHHVEQLPNTRSGLAESFVNSGIEEIADIPAAFPGLSNLQIRVRDSVINGQPYIDPELSRTLRGLSYPILYLDFETFSPALPLYVGTRPYEAIPFQWSMHIQDSDGAVTHQEFLYEGIDDPRPDFISSLISAAGSIGPIVTYSGYEGATIKGLATNFSKYEGGLLAVRDRIFDLYKAIRDYYYHPEFHGSFSLKSVLPALVPDLGYADLDISEGSVASIVFVQTMDPGKTLAEKDRLRTALLAYCRRDTEAMVKLLATFVV
jgi:hypothetical protein